MKRIKTFQLGYVIVKGKLEVAYLWITIRQRLHIGIRLSTDLNPCYENKMYIANDPTT